MGTGVVIIRKPPGGCDCVRPFVVRVTKQSSSVGRWTRRSRAGRPTATRCAPTWASTGPAARDPDLDAVAIDGRSTPGSCRSVRTSISPSVKMTVAGTPDASTIEAGVPSATMRPRSSTTMRSHRPLGLLHIVGHQDDRRPARADAPHDVPGSPATDRIEVLGQLVEEDQPRPADERERDEQALALAAGERLERPAPQMVQMPFLRPARRAIAAADAATEKVVSASPTRMRSGRAASCNCAPICRRRRSPTDAGSRPRTLTMPRISVPQTLQDLDGGRLAGAVRAEQAEQLARPRRRTRCRAARVSIRTASADHGPG